MLLAQQTQAIGMGINYVRAAADLPGSPTCRLTSRASCHIAAINEYLDAATEPVSFWKHKSLWIEKRMVFREDGVHFHLFHSDESCQNGTCRAANKVNLSIH